MIFVFCECFHPPPSPISEFNHWPLISKVRFSCTPPLSSDIIFGCPLVFSCYHLQKSIKVWFFRFVFSFLCSITVLSVGLVDFVVSIIQRYSGGENGSIGYSAHIAGGTAGILIGMNVLQNFHHKVHTRGYQISRYLLWVRSSSVIQAKGSVEFDHGMSTGVLPELQGPLK